MKKRKARRIGAICIVFCIALVFAACDNSSDTNVDDAASTENTENIDTSNNDTASNERTFAVICKTLSNSWATKLQLGALKAAEDIGVKVEIVAPEKETDTQKQIQFVEDFITQGVDGIALCPAGSAELVPAVKKANEAGIPVVIFDTPLDDNAVEQGGAEYVTYIGTENYAAGSQGAELCAELLKDGGEVCVIEGVPGQDTSEQRVSGFKETLEKLNPNIKVVADQPGYWEANKGLDVATNAYQANPDLDVVWVASDLMGVGVAQMIKNEKLEDKLTIIGVDGQLEAIEFTLEGTYYGTIGQSPFDMTYQSITSLNDVLDGKEVEPIIYTDMPTITKTNAQEYLDQEQEYAEQGKKIGV